MPKSRTKPQKSYAFINNEGVVKYFDGKATISDLLAMGVTRIEMVPNNTPMPEDRNIYVHASTDDITVVKLPPYVNTPPPSPCA